MVIKRRLSVEQTLVASQRIKMRYSIERKDRIYVNGYRFLSLAKNLGKNLSNKYGQKLLDTAKKNDNKFNKN